MKKCSAIVPIVLGGCFSLIIVGLVVVALVVFGASYFWDKSMVDEPLTEAEDAKIREITTSVEKLADEDATVSLATRNTKHSSPQLSLRIAAAKPLSEDRARSIVTAIDNELRTQMPKGWKVSSQRYLFDRVNNRQLTVLADELLPGDVDKQLDMAFAAPQTTDQLMVRAPRNEVRWLKLKDASCMDFFTTAESAAAKAPQSSANLNIEVRECEGVTTLANFRYSITAQPEEVPEAVTRMRQLQPQLKGRGVAGARIHGDGSLVLLPESFQKKDPKNLQEKVEEHLKPADFRDVWPHGTITIADGNFVVS